MWVCRERRAQAAATEVGLPEGTRVRPSSLAERRADDPGRGLGLDLDARWAATWPAVVVDWLDASLPYHPDEAVAQIEAAFARAHAGEGVEIGCLGGLGRTGTLLACLALLAGLEPAPAVAWVREHSRAGPSRPPSRSSGSSSGLGDDAACPPPRAWTAAAPGTETLSAASPPR